MAMNFMIAQKAKTFTVNVGLIFLLAVFLGGCAASGNSSTTKQDEIVIESALLRAASDAEKRNNFDAAVGYYSRLLQAKPYDRDITIGLARNLRYVGQSASAADVLLELSRRQPDDEEIMLERAKALIASGGHNQALALLGDVISMNRNNWQAFSARGIAYDSLKNYKMAEKSFLEALAISPDNPAVLNNLAMSLAQAGRIKKAIATLERAALINRGSPQIRQNLALLYGISGDKEKAKSLAVMDLDQKEVETNASFYQRFDGAIQ